MSSIFLKLEGSTPKNKIWDFLITHQEFDYNLKEISELAEVSYATLKRTFPYFIKNKFVIKTRKIGKANLYKLNKRNKEVNRFIDYFWARVDAYIEEHQDKKKFVDTAPLSVPVSARSL